MNLNKESINLIKSFEGIMLKAYRDSVGVLTIGYGHTTMAGPPAVIPGMIVTEVQATDLLASDLKKYCAMVDRNVKVELNPNQYGALVSFTYNLGEGSLKSSTLLKKVNVKDFVGASKEFAKWNHAGGQVLKGLTRRRMAEAALFLKPALQDTHSPVQTIPEDVAIQPPLDHVPTVAPPVAPTKGVGFIGLIIGLFNLFFGKRF